MKRYIALLLAFLMAASLLAGCVIPGGGGSEETFPTNENPLELIIILGSHENAWLSLNDLCEGGAEADDFAELIARTMEYVKGNGQCTAKCHVKVLVCDGNPRAVTLERKNGTALPLTKTSPNPTYISNCHKELAAEIAEALQRTNMIADDPEVDLVTALLEASHMFETDGERMIYIMDTGLCTAGPLNLQEINLQEWDYKDIMLRLSDGEFADLEGVQVKFRNLGDVCGEQDPITDNELVGKLEVMWSEYLKRCNVVDPIVKYNSNEFNPAEDQAAYDAIDFPHTVTALTLIQGEEPEPPRPANEPFDPIEDANLILNDASVGGFDKNSYVPNDEERAREVAAEKKELLENIQREYSDTVFYVIGSCSYRKGKAYDTHPDALNRAKTIAQYLIEAGVPADRIVVVDAGTNVLLWRNADEETEKDQNQVVAIIPSYRVEIIKYLHGILGDRIPLPQEVPET